MNLPNHFLVKLKASNLLEMDFTKETIQRKNEVTRFMLFLYFSKIQNVEDLESLLLKVVGALNLPF